MYTAKFEIICLIIFLKKGRVLIYQISLIKNNESNLKIATREKKI